ncbi:MAG: peptidase S41, partial [Bacteroidaceae bacterium]|nr:peptidase S41 [Bacteroidaceae bacterium]
GGGIMPDQFVPLDTTRLTPLYRQISARGMIVQANLRFLDKNRKQLSKKWKQFADFKEQFEIPEETLDAILTEAEEKNFKPKDEEERQQTRRQLALTLKALVARDLWDMSEYFSIIYQDDPVVLKAVEMIEGR